MPEENHRRRTTARGVRCERVSARESRGSGDVVGTSKSRGYSQSQEQVGGKRGQLLTLMVGGAIPCPAMIPRGFRALRRVLSLPALLCLLCPPPLALQDCPFPA